MNKTEEAAFDAGILTIHRLIDPDYGRSFQRARENAQASRPAVLVGTGRHEPRPGQTLARRCVDPQT